MTELIRNRASQTFRRALISRSTNEFQVAPTLAIGDVMVKKDAGAWANIATLPTVGADEEILVTLSQAETDCSELLIRYKDVAGAQWHDALDVFSPKDFGVVDFPFYMVLLNGDPALGKTIVRERSLNGGAFGVGTLGAVTEVGNGTYKLTIPHADLNGAGSLRFSEGTCQPRVIHFLGK